MNKSFNSISSRLLNKLQERNLLKSAYYSAKIEGNNLSFEEVLKDKKRRDYTVLLPKRKELLNIIKKNNNISLNLLMQYYPNIPARTLRNDLSCLSDKEFIIKRGSTRGAVYAAREGYLFK